jgi:hypothetical protein
MNNRWSDADADFAVFRSLFGSSSSRATSLDSAVPVRIMDFSIVGVFFHCGRRRAGAGVERA